MNNHDKALGLLGFLVSLFIIIPIIQMIGVYAGNEKITHWTQCGGRGPHPVVDVNGYSCDQSMWDLHK